jgi:hypothetical protein
MRRGLQILLAAGGLSCIGIGLLLVIGGPALIPGAIAGTPSMDSETRFYAAVFAAYGAVAMGCARAVERKTRTVELLAAALFAGGVARLISWAAVGRPHGFFIAMAALELGLPPIMVLMTRRLRA